MDAINRVLHASRGVADTINVTDSLYAARQVAANLSDVITLTDSLTALSGQVLVVTVSAVVSLPSGHGTFVQALGRGTVNTLRGYARVAGDPARAIIPAPLATARRTF